MRKLIFEKDIAGWLIETNAVWGNPSGDLTSFVEVSSSFYSDLTQVVLTGWAFETSDSPSGFMFQDITGHWIESGNYVKTKEYEGNAQDFIDIIIKNNRRIYENNLLCATAAKYMTDDDLYLLEKLQNRLLVRNQALEDDNLTTSRQVSYPKGYINLYDNLESIMNEKVGVVISAGAMIVIAAVVISAVSFAAYYAYSAFAAESEEDVKFSDELTAKLVAKLSPEELEQLYNETEGFVTKARLKEKFGTIAGLGSTLLWLAAGGALLYWWQSRSKSKKTSKKKEQ